MQQTGMWCKLCVSWWNSEEVKLKVNARSFPELVTTRVTDFNATGDPRKTGSWDSYQPSLGDQAFSPNNHRGNSSGIGNRTSGILFLGVKFYISYSFVTLGKLSSITLKVSNS